MKKRIIYTGLIGLLSLGACELLDPTEVINPNITADAALDTKNPMIAWLAGMDRQMAIVLNGYVTISEIASDNYENTRTFFNQNLDNLIVQFKDADVNTAQFAIGRLREQANYGLTVVKAADENTTPDQEAELYFYRGFAQLLAGELFVALPAEPNGVALSSEANFELAIADFNTALSLTTNEERKAGYNIALARAYYRTGNKAEAQRFAQAAIALNSNYLRVVEFDDANGPGNTMEDAIFDRNTFDDLQPLPRLDFLDPKYNGTATEADAIPLLKIEEAYLILAEVALANNMLADAKTSMKNAITVVQGRPLDTFNDLSEGRPQATPPAVAEGDRPNKANIRVAASASAPFRTGLVLDRQAGVVSVPSISGTSINAADVDALTTEDAALETLYLMRQEIFIAEGRRMVDLGIKFPVSEIEQLSNALIVADQTQGFVPSFIPKDGIIDQFTYDKAANTVVIEVNLNKILVENKTSEAVLPFY